MSLLPDLLITVARSARGTPRPPARLALAPLFWLWCAQRGVLGGRIPRPGALDVAAPSLFVYSLFLAVVGMPLVTLAGIAYDVQHPASAA
jgi:hypothetical protein